MVRIPLSLLIICVILGKLLDFSEPSTLTRLLLGFSKIVAQYRAQYLVLSSDSRNISHFIPNSPLFLHCQGPLLGGIPEAFPYSQAGLRVASLLCPCAPRTCHEHLPCLPPRQGYPFTEGLTASLMLYPQCLAAFGTHSKPSKCLQTGVVEIGS